jgi:ATP-dependent exoDNAse (exonuclease V) alpha subunit
LSQDRQAFWSAVERKEKRRDAQLAREVEISLPHNLPELERELLATAYIISEFTDQGMVVDVSFHPPTFMGDIRNYHMHLLVTMRDITPEGFGKKKREWNSKSQLLRWRRAWARHVSE